MKRFSVVFLSLFMLVPSYAAAEGYSSATPASPPAAKQKAPSELMKKGRGRDFQKPVTLRLSAHKVLRGSPVTVSGRVKGKRSAPVLIQSRTQQQADWELAKSK